MEVDASPPAEPTESPEPFEQPAAPPPEQPAAPHAALERTAPPNQRARFSAAAQLEADIDRTDVDSCQQMSRYLGRHASLEQFLSENYKMGVRDDSMLAYRFCMGADDLDDMWQDVGVVAHELACIQLIHDLTPYDEVCQTALREMAGVLNRVAGMPWGDAWQRVRTYGVPIVKMAAALSCEPALPCLVATA